MKKNKIEKIYWKSKKRVDWLAQRNDMQGIGSYDKVSFGSSDISTIMGFNKWSSRKKLFWNMLGVYITEFNSFKLEMGLQYEAVNARSFEAYMADRDGFDDRFCKQERLRKLQSPKYFLVNEDYPYTFSSLDFIMPSKSLCPMTGEITKKSRPVETKFVNFNSYSSWKGTIPMYYKTQLTHQIAELNSDAGYLSVIAGGDYYDCFILERDNFFIEEIKDAVHDFSLNVLKGKQVMKLRDEELLKSNPDQSFLNALDEMLQNLEPEANEYDLEFIDNELFPESNSLEMPASEEQVSYIKDYLEAHERENQAKSDKTLVRAKISQSMQGFEVLKSDGHKVINRKSLDGKSYFKVS